MKIPFSSFKDWRFEWPDSQMKRNVSAKCAAMADDGRLFMVDLVIKQPVQGQNWIVQMTPRDPMPETDRVDREVDLGEYESIEDLADAVMNVIRLGSIESSGTEEMVTHVVRVTARVEYTMEIEALSPFHAESMVVYGMERGHEEITEEMAVEDIAYEWKNMSAAVEKAKAV